MPVYKISEKFIRATKEGFSGFVFDCDGVLIDASSSYDLALRSSTEAFASLLGVKIEDSSFEKMVGVLRELGTFNNDWDTLAVLVASLYRCSKDTSLLDRISTINSLEQKLKEFEIESTTSRQASNYADFDDLIGLVRKTKEGTRRDDIIARILPLEETRARLYRAISYPEPVGKGLLSTLFDEIVYGRSVFKETYGFDCVTQRLSVPGLIVHERKLVSDSTFCALYNASGGRLGIITGRPRVPTIYTLGSSYSNWFRDPGICLFTGDYMLDAEEVKPSPKPMLRVAAKLPSISPIVYVGDSGEDLMMTRNANPLLDERLLFVAVANSKEKRDFFEKHDDSVDCIVSNVNELEILVREQMPRAEP